MNRLLLILLVSISSACYAQHPLLSKVVPTPDDVLKMFRDAGMSPVEHPLTDTERTSIAAAFTTLPPLHQRILKDHLDGISFLDNMPNTALTSIVNPDDSVRRYHITFRAAILKQTISEWLTEKEQTLFSPSSDTVVSLHAGNLNAIIYVLLHETTHVIDGSLDLFNTGFAAKFATPVWRERTTLINGDSLLRNNHFRRGPVYSTAMAYQLYKALQQTPLVSIYSTSSWSEDLAEYLTVYHLTRVLKQPFSIELKAGGKTILNYLPLGNRIVAERMKSLGIFYAGKKA